jgi:hypothetical protein
MTQSSSPISGVAEEKASIAAPPAYFSIYSQALGSFQYQYVVVK